MRINHCRYRRLTRSDTGNSEHDLHRVCTESAPSHLCNSICSKASIPRSSGYRRKVANQVASVEFDEYIRIRMSSKCQVNVKLADIHQHLTIESLWGHVVSEERSFAFLPSSFPCHLLDLTSITRPKVDLQETSSTCQKSRLQPSDFAASSVETGEFATPNVRDNQTTCATCVNQSLKPRCSRPLP